MTDKLPEHKMAPVQGWPQGIPWSLHLEAYAAYCKKWGPQPALIDLEERNCRGGFGTEELDEFVPGWRDKVSELTRLRTENAALHATLKQAQAALGAMLTHMGMDEDEWNKPTFDQARTAIQAIDKVQP